MTPSWHGLAGKGFDFLDDYRYGDRLTLSQAADAALARHKVTEQEAEPMPEAAIV
ncbi:hypothetical protein [Breoghania sp.]|uniref:hypothetical protein n=1 Tax=Breoghania sp. TaxID=2065378 RepID=UPI0026210685|nr:hypothetical protein [Breoghania sp.]MDJ0933513.1 hypothetical protein [Breoghania sp.]